MKQILTAILSLLLLSISSAHAQRTAIAPVATIQIKRSGSQPSQKAPAEHFTGSVYITPVFGAMAPGRTSGGSVTFAPGARSAWHTHPFGQTLIVTDGIGWIQQWGGPIQEIRKGDVVSIPPGVKHWHGAAPDSPMTHLAVQEEIDGKNVNWLEKVSDAQYGVSPAPTQGTTNKTMSNEPSRAQQLMGDVAPKLAQLTDDVLFGDVWARPGLSQRDRSLITVAALIMGGNTEQLSSHLARAKTNGITEAEVSEIITHLAFYAGWPRAISAVPVARKVFADTSTPGENK